MNAPLKKTSLHELHVSLGAKMTPFAGYEMPIQYPLGVMKEHLHTREQAGLFDVSHMGQAWLKTTIAELGTDDAHKAVGAAIESLIPGEIQKLKRGGVRYSALLNDEGGILDDLMVTRPADQNDQGKLFLVVNAACKDGDFKTIAERLDGRATLEIAEDRSLLALQGPRAAEIVDSFFPGAASQGFMTMREAEWNGGTVYLSRCGYTGEDGFEISIRDADAARFAQALIDSPAVEPIGLGARDSLRLEAGLCLYGADIDETTSPVEGNIAFAIGKRRRADGGFPGAGRILGELADGPSRLRVGLQPEGRAPARAGTAIVDASGAPIGVVTSGGFGPTVGGPVAMGYVSADHAATGSVVNLVVRGKTLPARVVDMPFTPANYYRGK